MTKMPCRITDEFVPNPWEGDDEEEELSPEEEYEAKIKHLANELHRHVDWNYEKKGFYPTEEDAIEIQRNIIEEIFGELPEIEVRKILTEAGRLALEQQTAKLTESLMSCKPSN